MNRRCPLNFLDAQERFYSLQSTVLYLFCSILGAHNVQLDAWRTTHNRYTVLDRHLSTINYHLSTEIWINGDLSIDPLQTTVVPE